MFIEINVNTANLPKKMKKEWWGSEDKEISDGDITTLRRIVNSAALEDIALFEEQVKLGSKNFVPVYGVRMYGSARNDFGSSKFTEYYKTKEEAEKRYNEILSVVIGCKPVVEEQKSEVEDHTAKPKRGRKKG